MFDIYRMTRDKNIDESFEIILNSIIHHHSTFIRGVYLIDVRLQISNNLKISCIYIYRHLLLIR